MNRSQSSWYQQVGSAAGTNRLVGRVLPHVAQCHRLPHVRPPGQGCAHCHTSTISFLHSRASKADRGAFSSCTQGRLTADCGACCTGDDVSGWNIRGVAMTPYSYPMCDPFFTYGGTVPQDRSNASDPAPLVPASVGNSASELASTCAAVITSSRDPVASPLWRHDLNRVSDPGVVHVSTADANRPYFCRAQQPYLLLLLYRTAAIPIQGRVRLKVCVAGSYAGVRN